MAKKKLDNFEEVEGVICEIKNPLRESTVRFIQNNLREEIDKYISSNIMTDKKKGYVSALENNIKIAPFVLGWLKWPTDEELQIIKGLKKPETKKGPTKKVSPSSKKK